MYKVGIGYDVHQFKIGESFILGGVEIDFEKGGFYFRDKNISRGYFFK